MHAAGYLHTKAEPAAGWLPDDAKSEFARLLEQNMTKAALAGQAWGNVQISTSTNFDTTLNEATREFISSYVGQFADEWVQGEAKAISEAVSAGLEAGDSMSTISGRISDVFGGEMGDSKALMIARTETIRASNEGALSSYRDAQVEQKEWSATDGEGTCEVCEGVDGQVVGINEDFDTDDGSMDAPPAHPNCRCSVLPVLPEFGAAGGDATSMASDLADEAATNEPGVTSLLSGLADDAGGELVGLDYRLKTEESILRKMTSDQAEQRLSAREAASGVNDALRYTMTTSEADYAKGVESVTRSLLDQGYENVKWKQMWNDAKRPDYRGLNTVWRSPEGQRLELQFHTADSFEAKMVNHADYEVWRAASTTQDERTAAMERMVARSEDVVTPDGATSLTKSWMENLPAETKAAANLESALTDWVVGGQGEIRDSVLTGNPSGPASAILERLSTSADNYDGVLYRGMQLSDDTLARWGVDVSERFGSAYSKQIDLNLSSWSTDRAVALTFADGSGAAGGVFVNGTDTVISLLHEPGQLTPGIDLSAFSWTKMPLQVEKEKEWIFGGRITVDSWRMGDDNVMRIKVYVSSALVKVLVTDAKFDPLIEASMGVRMVSPGS